jgi:hypothetical protein
MKSLKIWLLTFWFTLPWGNAHAETQPLELTVFGSRVYFEKSAVDFEPTQVIVIGISGQQAGRLQVFLEDKVVLQDGSVITLPLGTADNSLKEALKISPRFLDYQPSEIGAEQQFSVQLSIDPEQLVKPLQGELLIKLTPRIEESGEGLSVNQAMAIGLTAVAVPSLGDLRLYDLRIRNESLKVSILDKTAFIDRVVPDIPRLINSGPVSLELSSQNIGDILLEKRAVFKIYRVSPLSVFQDEEREPFYTINGEPRLVLAGANFVSGYSSLIKVENGTDIDALPFIGIVKFEATAEGEISGVVAPLENEPIVKYFLVFPWKWTLIILIFLAFYFFLKFSRRNKSGAWDNTDTIEFEKITQAASSELALQLRAREPIEMKLPKKAAARKPTKKTPKVPKKRTVPKQTTKAVKKKAAAKKTAKAAKKKTSARKPARSAKDKRFVISIK